MASSCPRVPLRHDLVLPASNRKTNLSDSLCGCQQSFSAAPSSPISVDVTPRQVGARAGLVSLVPFVISAVAVRMPHLTIDLLVRSASLFHPPPTRKPIEEEETPCALLAVHQPEEDPGCE